MYRIAELPPEASVHTKEELADPDLGMHQSDTVDIITILSGEICHKLKGSDEVLLKAGDTLVQRGTWHAWRNRSNKPCRFIVIKVGGK